jgi:UDP-arabinose 4-epimerase
MPRTILVTGGAGYIGSHTCKALAQDGYLPVVYDNLSAGHADAVQWGPLEMGDCSDRTRLDAVITRHHPVAVIHFAAFAYVGESVNDPAKYYRNNVAGALTLLEAMHAHSIPSIIFSSSCATYGIPQHIPIPDDHAQMPINPYGRTKLMVEQMLADFSAAYGLHYAALRYFNASGADPDGAIGETHDPEPHLIPRVLAVAAGKCPSIEIYGNDYATTDGTCIRDYVHVCDLAQAHVLALDYIGKTKKNLCCNIGTGKGASVAEIIAMAEKITGRPIPVTIAPRRPGDPPELVAAAGRARELLQWQPRFPDVGVHIEHAWGWMQTRGI